MSLDVLHNATNQLPSLNTTNNQYQPLLCFANIVKSKAHKGMGFWYYINAKGYRNPTTPTQ